MRAIKGGQSGLSLVEIAVFIGIMGVVGYLAMEFFGTASVIEVKKQMRSAITMEMQRFTSKATKDFRLQVAHSPGATGTACPTAQCPKITLYNMNTAMTGDVHIHYQTVCPAGPGGGGSWTPVTSCLGDDDLECPGGGKPTIRRIMGAEHTLYFHELHKRKLASSVCFEAIENNNMRMHVRVKHDDDKVIKVQRVLSNALGAGFDRLRPN